MFKAVLITSNRIPFRLDPDIPEDLKGRLNWARRNHEYHKDKAETLKQQLEQQSGNSTNVIAEIATK